jgi:hypothetical protein
MEPNGYTIGLFELSKVILNGQPSRAFAIRCGRCRRIETVKMNTMHGSGDTTLTENRIATRKFERMGWNVGDTAGRHRCPACLRKPDMAKKIDHLYEVSHRASVSLIVSVSTLKAARG